MSAALAGRYQELDVLTMSPARRVVLLYAHLVGNLRAAATTLPGGAVAERVDRLGKAGDIVAELLGSLDCEKGGPLADQLASLYVWFTTEINAISIRPDGDRLARLIEIASGLQEAWREASELLPADAPGARVA